MRFPKIQPMFTAALLLALAVPAFAQDAAKPAEQAAAPATAAAQTTEKAAAPAAATAAKPSGLIPAAPADKGQIVFFRPSKFAGGAVGFKVREGEKELGKLRSGTYFVAIVDPGKHTYIVHSEAKDVLDMEVDAGETYYVQGTINMGFMVGRPNLSPSDQATFDGMAAKLRKSE